MEVIREKEIELYNGEQLKIVTLKGSDKESKRTCEILVNSKNDIITPEVKSIKYDQEHQMFLVRDKLPIDDYLTGSIYYYINYQGIPVGLCFFDVKEGFYTMDFTSSDDYKNRYFSFKLAITQKIREEVSNKTERDLENCKKMALYKKGVIESEDKI